MLEKNRAVCISSFIIASQRSCREREESLEEFAVHSAFGRSAQALIEEILAQL